MSGDFRLRSSRVLPRSGQSENIRAPLPDQYSAAHTRVTDRRAAAARAAQLSKKDGWVVASILAIALVVSVTSHLHRLRTTSGRNARSMQHHMPRIAPRGHKRVEIGLNIRVGTDLYDVGTNHQSVGVDEIVQKNANTGSNRDTAGHRSVLQPDVTAASDEDIDRLARGGSVYCSGSSVDNRTCRFDDMCYIPRRNEYVLPRGVASLLHGVPSNRFDPALLTLSSVQRHNAMHMSFVDVPADQFTNASILPKHIVFVVSAPVLLLYRFKPNNVMHILHDDVLPVLHTLRAVGRLGDGSTTMAFMDPLGVHNESDDWYKLLLPGSQHQSIYRKMLPTSVDVQGATRDAIVCFRRAYAGVIKEPTWYDYGFLQPQGPIPNHPATSAPYVRWATNFLAAQLGAPALPSSPPVASPGLPVATWTQGNSWSVVLFARTRNRLIMNQPQLIQGLESKFGRHVTVLSLETHSIQDIITVLRSTAVAVGMHGSILVLAMFMPPGSILVELFPFGVPSDNYTPYKVMCGLPGVDLRYVAWENQNLANTVAHPKRPPYLGGIVHLDPNTQHRIQSAHTVPQHLCCEDPYWLYYIYQDTTVDVEDLLPRIPMPASDTYAGDDVAATGVWRQLYHAIVPARVQGGVTCTYHAQVNVTGTGAHNGGASLQRTSPAHMRVAFAPSWNAPHVNGLYYEVHIKELGKMWRVPQPYLLLAGESDPDPESKEPRSDAKLSVWVRPMGAHVVGPVSEAFSCTLPAAVVTTLGVQLIPAL
eukprot:m.320432 g.320432  ORF g.320432 m.320432 type:complete len:760 (-) comp20320_c0_seq3:522-2801(-)